MTCRNESRERERERERERVGGGGGGGKERGNRSHEQRYGHVQGPGRNWELEYSGVFFSSATAGRTVFLTHSFPPPSRFVHVKTFRALISAVTNWESYRRIHREKVNRGIEFSIFSTKFIPLTPNHWCCNYSGSHPFYAKLWTVADQKPMVKKIWKNMKNHGMVCPPTQNQKEDKNPSGSYHNHLPPPPFFEDFGGVSTSNVPSYEWSSWQLRRPTRRA